MSRGPAVCEMYMVSIGSCIFQTIVAYATILGVQLDSIRIQTEGDIGTREFTGVSEKVSPGAQEFSMVVLWNGFHSFFSIASTFRNVISF